MTPSPDHHNEGTSQSPAAESPMLRRVINEYPAGYVAQLARQFSARRRDIFQRTAGEARTGVGDSGGANHRDRRLESQATAA